MSAAAAAPDSVAAGPGRPRDPQVDRAILDAVVALLSDSGVEAVTVEGVACRAGVSRASVYRRYANRVDLIEAAFHATAQQKADPPDTGSVRSDLVQLVQLFRHAILDSDPGRMLPAMLSAARDHEEVREALQRFTSSRRAPTVEIIRRGIERGELRTDADPELMTDLLVGAVMYRVLLRNGTVGVRRAEQLVDTVLDGVRA